MRASLLIVLGLAVGASLWVAGQDGDDIAPVRREARGGQADRQQGGRAPRVARRDEAGAEWVGQALADGAARWALRRDAASKQPAPAQSGPSAWQGLAPPPPPVATLAMQSEAPPPPPQAPAFPHKWIGRFIDEAGDESQAATPLRRALVAGPASTWVLREGDVIEGQWRVDRIGDTALALTYLPLQLPQSVAMKSP